MPWSNDKYLKTCMDDDAALQFDIDEDLDTLDFNAEINNNIENKLVSNEGQQSIKYYENKLKESESKIEELVELVDKLRYFRLSIIV